MRDAKPEAQERLESALESPFMGANVRIWRDEDGDVRTNIPRCLIQHSPTGFEVGYGGSGPADLALNIMAAFFPLAEGEEGVKTFCGRSCSQRAWDAHQGFKREFISRIHLKPGEETLTPSSVIREAAEIELAGKVPTSEQIVDWQVRIGEANEKARQEEAARG